MMPGLFQTGVRRAVSLVSLAVGGLLMSGCQAVSTNSPSVSQLRIIYASPDSGGVDIYASNAVLAYNLGFGTTTSYIPITPATYKLDVDQANTRTVLTTTRATLANSKQYTLLVGNVAASLQSTVLQDQSTPAPSGQIALRIIDQATKVGPVDIYLIPSGSTLQKVNPVLTNVTLGVNTQYINVPVGTYAVNVLTAGEVPVDTTVPLYAGSAVAYPQGSARTLVLLDRQVVNNPGLQVITANDYDSATASQ
ncbi:MAG: DUF4397 domain-containing protein [Acidobacteria bacterium]|nr:DUF4397 domain-containing protein [Acidobacteriota bacterium]